MDDGEDEGGCVDVDEAIEMQGIERECNDMEKTMAHSLIRRSVVRKKLNWSQQFSKGSIQQHHRNDLQGVQRTFQETQNLKLLSQMT
jgi:hypothetical protein